MPTLATSDSENLDLHPFLALEPLVDELNGGVNKKTWSYDSWRYLLANRERNGLDKYVRMVGRKRVTSLPGVRHWLETRDSRAA